ncbi:Ig-like domain-containing protein [Gramella sp. AN32]|uniref:Ig-like domain-containing protein n=1 Tax=Christiangramia antarctica TaxID=2058158 RepID=A0ABW5WZM8_9FLAO|nr:Ig-like domain-containing protein [Gramella sp. AN32]MCM4155210.1 hypothetical protein [Gramella sp. AN32]
MIKRVPGYILVMLCIFSLVQCAKKGMPEGGPIDEDPPVFIRANPENYTTHFKAKEIRIYFDEYIKLEKPQQQIIISPPMVPTANITPLGTARKDIKIEIFDTLAENTTYAINFGKSIVDNNEGNSFDFFKYVFSTGDYIDSLTVSGTVKDALLKEPKEPISVFLYEIDSTYSDSIVYKETPRYVTYSKDSTFTFSLENLKEGQYKMVAMLDKNNNYLFNPRSEKIGFVEQTISIPTDSTYNLTVFKEQLEFNVKRPSHFKGNVILFGYEGAVKPDSIKIDLLNGRPEGFVSRIIKDKVTDSLYYWYNIKPEIDSLSFKVSTPKTIDTLFARLTSLERDSISISTEPGSIIGLDEKVRITSTTPIMEFNEEFINLIDKDSAEVVFTSEYFPLKNSVELSFAKKPENNYTLSAFPGAMIDLFNETNDSIQKSFKTKSLSEFGSVQLNIVNVDTYPIIVQLTDTKGEVKAEKFSENSSSFPFNYLEPGKYLVRVIDDTNGNGKWDTGNYLKKIQPERIRYYSDTLEMRKNWDFKENVILK